MNRKLGLPMVIVEQMHYYAMSEAAIRVQRTAFVW